MTPKKQDDPSAGGASLPAPAAPVPGSRYFRQTGTAPEPLFARTPGAPPSLPPLFEHDPLYAPPVTRSIRVFSIAKGSGTALECEDAVAVSADEHTVALCDGTSTTNLPRSWASILARHWVAQPLVRAVTPDILSAWIETPRSAWRDWIRAAWFPTLNARNRQMGLPELPLDRAEEVMAGGASSTLVGVRLHGAPGAATWEAAAIGDSCLFVLEPASATSAIPATSATSGAPATAATHIIARSFPLAHSAAFNDRPPILTTRDIESATAAARYVSAAGVAGPDTILALASDALAKWILQEVEQRASDPWQTLLALRGPDEFRALAQRERATGRLADDDTTLVIIPIGAALA